MTVGIDIGTSSVKALAADDAGRVVATAKVAHGFRTPEPDHLEHDADLAWRRNVRTAWSRIRRAVGDRPIAAVDVAAMVPSLCAVDDRGVPITPGLLYTDARGKATPGLSPNENGELLGFARWCAKAAPKAAGLWPAQAVANHALTRNATIDYVTAATAVPLFDWAGWDRKVARRAGIDPAQLPTIATSHAPIGTAPGGVPVGPGTIDAFAEQLVAGADRVGDVLVILGSTLIVWVVTDDWVEVPGLWTVPHTAPGKVLVGGPSNAGGLFLEWVWRTLGERPERIGAPASRADLPVWAPYLRGERTPLHDASRRGALWDLTVTHGRPEIAAAAFEASGFVVRRDLELSGLSAKRIVATGGGSHSAMWVQAVADATGLPVDVVDVPEGGALGAAYLARVTAGLEADTAGAARWARTSRRVRPDATVRRRLAPRYQRFLEVAGPVPAPSSRAK